MDFCCSAVFISATICMFRFPVSRPPILIWLADNKVYFLLLVSVFRWSVMTYEVPTTTKRTRIVKEDDSLDSPLQVNDSQEAVCFLTDGVHKLAPRSRSSPAQRNYFGKHPLRINWAWQLAAKAIRPKPREVALVLTMGSSSVFWIKAKSWWFTGMLLF